MLATPIIFINLQACNLWMITDCSFVVLLFHQCGISTVRSKLSDSKIQSIPVTRQLKTVVITTSKLLGFKTTVVFKNYYKTKFKSDCSLSTIKSGFT